VELAHGAARQRCHSVVLDEQRDMARKNLPRTNVNFESLRELNSRFNRVVGPGEVKVLVSTFKQQCSIICSNPRKEKIIGFLQVSFSGIIMERGSSDSASLWFSLPSKRYAPEPAQHSVLVNGVVDTGYGQADRGHVGPSPSSLEQRLRHHSLQRLPRPVLCSTQKNGNAVIGNWDLFEIEPQWSCDSCVAGGYNLPPTEFWLEHPAMARERTGSGSAKGMAAGMQTQTVLLAPPSTPSTTLHPMRGLWQSSICHISLAVYLCILLFLASLLACSP
jgi:hypothetical protein